MQVSELYRRGAVVPRSNNAQDQLRAWDASPHMDVDVVMIASDAIFYEVWQAGLFSAINAACGSTLDDYEEEFLEPAQLTAAINATSDICSHSRTSPEAGTFLGELLELMRKAQHANRPVLFVL